MKPSERIREIRITDPYDREHPRSFGSALEIYLDEEFEKNKPHVHNWGMSDVPSSDGSGFLGKCVECGKLVDDNY